MRKLLLIILFLIAVPLYTWNIYMILGIGSAQKNKTSTIAAPVSAPIPLLQSVRSVAFVEEGKSPFVAIALEPRQKSVTLAAPKAPVEVAEPQSFSPQPPSLIITGIMWNSSNPLAMITLPSGQSVVAKAGETLGDAIMVKTIEKHRILVVSSGREFWIDK